MISQYVSATLVMTILGVYAVMSNTIGTLKTKNSELKTELATALYRNGLKDINIRDMNFSITTQNIEIDRLKIDYEAKILEYESREPDIIYKTIVKRVPVDTNITRGNCEDTKNVIDAISTIDFNSL